MFQQSQGLERGRINPKTCRNFSLSLCQKVVKNNKQSSLFLSNSVVIFPARSHSPGWCFGNMFHHNGRCRGVKTSESGVETLINCQSPAFSLLLCTHYGCDSRERMRKNRSSWVHWIRPKEFSHSRVQKFAHLWFFNAQG